MSDEIPSLAPAIPGAVEAYETYAATKAAYNADRSNDAAKAAFDDAMQVLSDLRSHWRQIGAFAELARLAEWQAANPEAAS